MQNVYNCLLGGSGGPYADQDVADDMLDWMDNIYTNLTGAMSQDLSNRLCTTYLYDAVGLDWDEVGSAVSAMDHTGTAEYLPPGVAALILASTEDPDVQGRKYFGGFTEDQITDGFWAGPLLTSLLATAADWIVPFIGAASGASFFPGVWSVKNLLLEPLVDSFVVNGIANYQRRRRPGVGI
jgi:hypothetical protein